MRYAGYTSTEPVVSPNLFIFSDYYPYNNGSLFDSEWLHCDDRTSILLESFCELRPNPAHYRYHFERDHVHFDGSIATGRALFFRANLWSHTFKQKTEKTVYGLYFFYENTNVIDQLFLRYGVDIPYLVWKRDGTGLGGGRLSHRFLYALAHRANTQQFYIWNHYQNQDIATVGLPDVGKLPVKGLGLTATPFSLKLQKHAQFRWCSDDKMNLYHCTPL